MPEATSAGVRRALLIGIDDYTKRPLDGCVADAELMARIIRERFAFADANVTVLRNRQASRDAVLSELDALIDATSSDDTAFFFYAGHGALAKNVDQSEASGWDNTLNVCEDPREDIYDYEIEARLQALSERTRYTVMIVDACNSATITRDVTDPGTAKERWNEPLLHTATSALDLGRHAVSGTRAVAGYTLITACRDDEIAKEAVMVGETTEHHGALTWALATELQQAAEGATWRDVFERVAMAVTKRYSDQHPQIEGRVDLELFGTREFAAMSSVGVTDRVSTSLVIAAGALQGVAAGATYTIYPQGTKRVTEAQPLGTVSVTLVKGTSARARIVTEASPGAIVIGSRAVADAPTTLQEALAIENPDPKSQLTGMVTLEILRLASDGTFDVADVDAAAGVPVFTSGDRIAFRITSRVTIPLFITLVEFDPLGVVSRWTTGNANQLAPKTPFEIGNRDGRELLIQWDADEAITSFKLFASVRAPDLRFLDDLNSRALVERPPISAEDWTTVTVRVQLQRGAT